MFENTVNNGEAGSDSDDAGFANRVPRTRAGNMSDASVDSTHARSALSALNNWDRDSGTRQRRGQENTENQTNAQTDNDEEQEESKCYI